MGDSMSFKFNVQQHVIVPGSGGIQGTIVATDPNCGGAPVYRVSYTKRDGGFFVGAVFGELDLSLANPTPAESQANLDRLCEENNRTVAEIESQVAVRTGPLLAEIASLRRKLSRAGKP